MMHVFLRFRQYEHFKKGTENVQILTIESYSDTYCFLTIFITIYEDISRIATLKAFKSSFRKLKNASVITAL